MSWSYRITILYLGFMALILTLVTLSMQNKEELVASDYNSQELNYQQKIDAINNSNALEQSITHSVNDISINLTLPTTIKPQSVNGDIYFYCPSNSKFDLKTKMNFDENGKQSINKNLLYPAVYKMILTWKANTKNYFKEEVISIK